MNIAGDERMCGKYLSRASEWGLFLEMRDEKCLLLPPPLTESGRLLETTENFCYYPPPPTESGRLFCYYSPPPLNRDGFWRARKILLLTPPPLNREGIWRPRTISATTPPPPVSCCAPPRLPAPDPPLDTHNSQLA